MNGRSTNLKQTKDNTVSKQVPKPKIGRIRKIFAAAGIAGALVLAGCAAKNKIDANFIIDDSAQLTTSWGQTKQTPMELFTESLVIGGSDWVNAHYASAIDHSIALEPNTLTSVNFGKFSIQIVPNYETGIMEIYGLVHKNESAGEYTTRTQIIDPSNPSFRFYDGPRPKDAEEKGQLFAVHNWETTQSLLPNPQPEYIGSLAISPSKLRLYDAGTINQYAREGRLVLLCDDQLNVHSIFVNFGKNGEEDPSILVNSVNWKSDVGETLQNSLEAGFDSKKNPLNAKFALAFQDTEDALNIFFAFGKEDPMDIVIFNLVEKAETGLWARSKFYAFGHNIISPNPSVRLLYAAKYGSLDQVKSLFEKGAEVDFQGEKDLTALLLASIRGDMDIVRYLVEEKKANLGLIQIDQFTALMAASYSGKEEVVKYLLEQGADPKTHTSGGWFALTLASQEGHQETVRAILEKDKSMIDAKNASGHTALMIAAIHGHLDTVKFLVKSGADRSATNNDGLNAEALAAKEGHKEIADYLILGE